MYSVLNYVVCNYRFDVEQTSNGTQLRTLGDLNREAVSTYSMTLLARDGGDPSFIDSVSIEVTVEDVNDINPVFTIDEYRVSLFEEADYTSFVIFHVSEFTCYFLCDLWCYSW